MGAIDRDARAPAPGLVVHVARNDQATAAYNVEAARRRDEVFFDGHNAAIRTLITVSLGDVRASVKRSRHRQGGVVDHEAGVAVRQRGVAVDAEAPPMSADRLQDQRGVGGNVQALRRELTIEECLPLQRQGVRGAIADDRVGSAVRGLDDRYVVLGQPGATVAVEVCPSTIVSQFAASSHCPA